MIKILIFENDSLATSQIKDTLKAINYSTTLITSPDSLFQTLKSESFDLILLNVFIEGVSNIKLLKQIKENSEYSEIPILLLMEEKDNHLLEECLENGAEDFIKKPIKNIILKRRIKSAIQNQRYLRQIIREMEIKEEKEEKLIELTNRLNGYQNIKDQSSRDTLTGLYNRSHFIKLLNLKWEENFQDKKNLTVVLIDIDFLKPYNDNFGHLSGDNCIRQIARGVRNINTSNSNKGTILARFGGNEFALLLPDTTHENAVSLAIKTKKYIEELNIPHAHSDVSDVVTISLGVASIIPQKNALQDYLLEEADKALKDAKREGRNKIKASELKEI